MTYLVSVVLIPVILSAAKDLIRLARVVRHIHILMQQRVTGV